MLKFLRRAAQIAPEREPEVLRNRKLLFENIEEEEVDETRRKFSLRFKDAKTEEAFCQAFYTNKLLRLKLAFLLTLVIWGGFIYFDFKEPRLYRYPYASLRLLIYIFAIPIFISLFFEKVQKRIILVECMMGFLQVLFCFVKITQGSLRFQNRLDIADLGVLISCMMAYFRTYCRIGVNIVCMVLCMVFIPVITLTVNYKYLSQGRELATILIINVIIQWATHFVSLVFAFYLESFARKSYIATKRREVKQRVAAHEASKTIQVVENIAPKCLIDTILQDSSDTSNEEIVNGAKYEVVTYSNPRYSSYDDVCLMYCDFQSFDNFASLHQPEILIFIINAYFTAFDKAIESVGVEKIKSFGDIYICAAGLVDNQFKREGWRLKFLGGDNLPKQRYISDQILQASSLILQSVLRLNMEMQLELAIRISIARAPMQAVVFGIEKLSFECFGDAFNEAKELNLFTQPNAIQVTEKVRETASAKFDFDNNVQIVSMKDDKQIVAYVMRSDLRPFSPRTSETSSTNPTDTMNQSDIDTVDYLSDLNVEQVKNVRIDMCYNPWKKQLKRLRFVKPLMAFPHPISNIQFFGYWYNESLSHIRVGMLMMLAAYAVVILSELMIVKKIGRTPALIIQYILFVLHLVGTVVIFTPLARRSAFTGVIVVCYTYTIYMIFPFSLLFTKSLLRYAAIYVTLLTMVVGFFAVMPLLIKGFLSLGVIVGMFIGVGVMSKKFEYSDFLFEFASLAIPLMAHAFMMKYLAPGLIMDKTVEVDVEVIKREKKRNSQWIKSSVPALISEKLVDPQFVYSELMNGSICALSLIGMDEIVSKQNDKALIILNEIFIELDRLTELINCRKVNSLGTLYLTASNREAHCSTIARFALTARETIQSILQRYEIQDAHPIIGIHTGQFIAGLVGYSKFLFDMFGEDVTTSLRLMLTCPPNSIHVSKKMSAQLTGGYDMSYQPAKESKDSTESYYLNAATNVDTPSTSQRRVSVSRRQSVKVSFLPSSPISPSNLQFFKQFAFR